ncbi:cation efflux system protein [Oceaniovalibus guishaninsula JLT2003]|uniref:Cation efflux system protein n=1 Tax=Oceaniovalibus guishaninsula JLT2003 TaxID=1231392 RepID=K2HGT5_9RHOB|nr:cation diffusion facilitator family transporter [Oceaniovalibus guishaninsula]EKE45647.1 cation efflux system protein [Oceaniovalibus guishaninsula JLT2003]
MAHGHHHHVEPGAGDRRVALAIAVNMGLTVAQVIGGIVSGSLSLIADALHNFSDAISLIIAFGARRIARRPADDAMTFGYGRIEAVAALVNYTTLIVIGLYLLYEAAERFIDPQPVAGWIVVAVAGVALAVDAVTALLTYALSKESVNIRAAFVHNVADALGSVGVIVAGSLILLYGWTWVDPAVTVLISGYILWQAAVGLPGVARILMLGVPPDMDPRAVLDRIRAVSGVADAHHLHLWMLDEHRTALGAHIVVAPGAWNRADAIKAAVKQALAEDGIGHVTLELECAAHACEGMQAVGHG